MKTPIAALALLTPILSAYDMHEWGTFTTVSGSDGTLLTGLHIEEEHLPPFVYSHVGMEVVGQARSQTYYHLSNQNFPARSRWINPTQVMVHENSARGAKKVQYAPLVSKGMPRANLQNVTVKMETPVIYFYGDDTPKVNVKVGFNGGTISQWYPQRKTGDTPNKVELTKDNASESMLALAEGKEAVKFAPIDFSKPYNGSIEWDVEILPKSEADTAFTFKPDENYTWIYPRVSDANMLKVGNEYEDYLFYRGIGNFDIPATFSVDADETLVVTNNSREAIPFAFAFENLGGIKYRYKTIGAVDSNSQAKVAEGEWVNPKNPRVEVFQAMRQGLVDQGLTMDEANGMVKTWWKSYFNKPGLRVFWVVPNYELEKILPLELTPKPEKSVRVIVGRADILRPRFEQHLISTLGTHKFAAYNQDRFYLPYKNRLEQLITEPVFTKFDRESLSFQSFDITAKKGKSSQRESIYLNPHDDVKLQHIPVKGKWEVMSDDTLKIGEHTFKLDPENGILTASSLEGEVWDDYQIQLTRVLN